MPALSVPRETIDRCIEYVKRSQNADGGFMYMLQAGGQSAFPRSAAGVVALYSAGIYDRPEIKKGLELSDGLSAAPRRLQPREPLLLRPLLRRAGDVARRRRILGSLVSGHSRRAVGPAGGRRLVDRFELCTEYGTAMAAIILQMPNNYLPIFQR